MAIPARLNRGTHKEWDIDHLYSFHKDTSVLADPNYPHILSFQLPSFQRPLCWTKKQNVKLIESIWLDLSIGSYTYHQENWDNNGDEVEYSGWLIDGQQRLNAISEYFDDKFKVYDLLFSQLSKREKRRFLGQKFSAFEIALWDIRKIKEFYNRMNFGGTPHKASEMAV